MKKILSIVFILSFFVFSNPGMAKASTLDDLMKQIISLQQQVSSLQSQVSALVLSATKTIIPIATTSVVPKTTTSTTTTTPVDVSKVVNPTPVPINDCLSTTTPWIKLISPNGGESYNARVLPDVPPLPITWTSCNIGASENIHISLDYPTSWGMNLSSANTTNTGSFISTTPPDTAFYSPGGLQYGNYYKMKISATTVTGYPTDLSDNTFTINRPQTTNNTTVSSQTVARNCTINSFTANPSSVIANTGSTKISWTTTGCAKVDITGTTSTGEAWDRGTNTDVNNLVLYGPPGFPFVFGNNGTYTFTLNANDFNGNIVDNRTIVVKVIDSVSKNTIDTQLTNKTITPNPATQAFASAAPNAIFNRTLKLGVRGKDVMALQQNLVNKKLLTANYVTGYFGTKTAEAVKKLQLANNLEADGKAGMKTLGLLNLGPAIPVGPVSKCIPGVTSPSITITSPNGGEVYHPEEVIKVNWKTCNIPANNQMGIYFVGAGPLGGGWEGTLLSANTNYVTPNDGTEGVTLLPASIILANNSSLGLHFKIHMTTSQVMQGFATSPHDYSDNLFTVQ